VHDRGGRTPTTLEGALKVLLATPPSPALVAYAERQHFTPRYCPAAPGSKYRAIVVEQAARALGEVDAQWLTKLTTQDQWAFLNLLCTFDAHHTRRLVYCYLGSSNPQTLSDAADKHFPGDVFTSRTQRRKSNLMRMLHAVPREVVDVADWLPLTQAHAVFERFTGSEEYDALMAASANVTLLPF